MADVVEGRVLVVGQGEPLSNGGTKYPLVMDNGSQLVTFSELCKSVVSDHIGEPLSFEVDPPAFEGGHPKVTLIRSAQGSVLWEPSSRGGGGGGGDPVTQHARTCIITAGQLVAARAGSYESEQGMAEGVGRMASFLAGLLKEVETELRK